MLNSASFARGLIAGYLALLLAANAAVALNAQKRWQFNDVSDDGHKIVLLTYGVPGTHKTQILALCEAARGDRSRFSTVLVVTDIKHFANGTKVNLRFSGRGFNREMHGRVITATARQHGITGVQLSLGHEDPLWAGLQSKQRLDVLLPDKRSFSLQLGNGAPKIRAFLEACKSYQQASNRPPETQPTLPPTHTPTPKTTPVAIGPGSTPWRHGNQMAAATGERRSYTASVTTGGIEFAAYCLRHSPSGPSLATVLREARKGTQPRLLNALRDGLAAASVATGDMKRVSWTFSSGYRSATAAALPQLRDGELRIASDRRNFRPGDPAIAALMASDTMTIAVGKFSSTFQLKGSRTSMCALARRCGARVPGCGLRRRTPQRVRRSTSELVVIRPRASPEIRPATQPPVRISR